MSKTEKDNLERVKQAVEDRAHLDPELQYKFVFEPVRVVESVAEIEKVPIKPEEAEKIAKELELPIKGGWPFIWGGLYSGMAMHVIERMRRGYDSIILWSRLLFWFGLGLIILAIGVDIAGIVLNISNPLGILLGFNWQQFVTSSAILGGIGLVSLVTSFIRFSFKEMKNTIGDLVQMSVIFHSFLDQITLLKTQVEKAGFEKFKEIRKEMDELVTQTIKNIQDYCETPTIKELKPQPVEKEKIVEEKEKAKTPTTKKKAKS